jgi:arylsulfatase A-like enzyme
VLPKGKTSPQAAITMDLNATILAATGTRLPTGYQPDGINILPIVTGQAPVVERQLFWRIDRPLRNQRAVRSGRWKMLLDASVYLLFDVDADPGERHDLAAQHPEVIVRLKSLLADWEKDTRR